MQGRGLGVGVGEPGLRCSKLRGIRAQNGPVPPKSRVFSDFSCGDVGGESVYSSQINVASTDQRKDSIQIQTGEPITFLGSLQEPELLQGGHSPDMSKQVHHLPLT